MQSLLHADADQMLVLVRTIAPPLNCVGVALHFFRFRAQRDFPRSCAANQLEEHFAIFVLGEVSQAPQSSARSMLSGNFFAPTTGGTATSCLPVRSGLILSPPTMTCAHEGGVYVLRLLPTTFACLGI